MTFDKKKISEGSPVFSLKYLRNFLKFLPVFSECCISCASEDDKTLESEGKVFKMVNLIECSLILSMFNKLPISFNLIVLKKWLDGRMSVFSGFALLEKTLSAILSL